MKVIAVGRNYAEHAKELNNPIPEKPVLFLKPDTAVLKNNKPFYIPKFSEDIHYELEIVLKIAKEGKFIAEKFAHKYYEELSVGIDFTARDIQKQQKEKGLPWEIAKSFDNSAPVGQFMAKSEIPDLQNLEFQLLINNEQRQKGNTAHMLNSFDQLISYASQYFTLKQGDLIFTGTPAGVDKIKIGDQLRGFLNGTELFNFEIK
ncbi:2-hydroxyhepta-2,4-diene-1,7-dioate isomerase [Pelobium manganitolerans]|uniref:2-hydroxyhepta-2,4-diene-1,7-dioate isomerase n=1 Tax=Pelobium manganitolerans TaxID=1842495 RepID=A0A419SAN4_9SPHI|nr:fumarylacetoacetate hydrolase family protein [Pelobium manganitolerans]RKD19533.1 2-hydroxyhepta-2,4-diene-1,7-dioate isomerase [Pelobium manganitolerans]